jgi:hypothetical protein
LEVLPASTRGRWWYTWTNCTLSGCLSGQAVLRREQWEQFESKHHENRATGRKVRPITDVTSTALGREEMAVCPNGLKEGAM